MYQKPTEEEGNESKAIVLNRLRLALDGSSSSMTAYLSKQQSCFANLDGSGDCGAVPYPFSWHHKHPNSHHCDPHHHLRQHYHYGSVSGRANLPHKVGGKVAGHLGYTLRSPSRLCAVKAKGSDCDLWPSDCGCIQRRQETYQVKICCYQSPLTEVSISTLL